MVGWLSIKEFDMKVKNFTGFVLGNENAVPQIGAPWMKTDMHVWVCPNLAKAKKVLVESHKISVLDRHPVWTTIYQVSGTDMVFEQANNGLLYTDVPSKLYVNRVVWKKRPEVPTEEFLLNNAKKNSRLLDLVNRMEK